MHLWNCLHKPAYVEASKAVKHLETAWRGEYAIGRTVHMWTFGKPYSLGMHKALFTGHLHLTMHTYTSGIAIIILYPIGLSYKL